VRSEAEIPRVDAALQLAKGLEFRAVIVMACDEDVIPNAERIKAITDDSDLHPRP
jgi:superfamily I DNA/RNA helicase